MPEAVAAVRQEAGDRDRVFAPIQAALIEQFGAHAAKFLLSNRVVSSILSGAITLQEIKPLYRQALIRGIAAKESIDLERYEGRETSS